MILVTGGTGFVGTQVVRHLHGTGRTLRVIVRSTERQTLLSGIETRACPDLFQASPGWWSDALSGVDTVVHLAWYAEPGEYLTSERNLDCLHGTLRLARACIDAGVRRFVGVGTCAEYAESPLPLHADAPLKPGTLYAACKAATFQVLDQLLPLSSVEFVWCRLFYLFGEGEDSRRFVPYLHRQLAAGLPADLTSGNQVRDYMDVSDAGATIAALAIGHETGAVNVCSGRPTTVRQLAERIADEYGRRDLLHFGVRPDNQFDPPCVLGVPMALAGSGGA